MARAQDNIYRLCKYRSRDDAADVAAYPGGMEILPTGAGFVLFAAGPALTCDRTCGTRKRIDGFGTVRYLIRKKRNG